MRTADMDPNPYAQHDSDSVEEHPSTELIAETPKKIPSTLSRIFTTRRSKNPLDVSADIPKASPNVNYPTQSTIRQQKISAPLQLISSTNMLTYNAPDIYPREPVPSPTSRPASNVGIAISRDRERDSPT
jgi:hypothetical protein